MVHSDAALLFPWISLAGRLPSKGQTRIFRFSILIYLMHAFLDLGVALVSFLSLKGNHLAIMRNARSSPAISNAGGELMFKKLGLATFLIAAGLALVSPNAAQARERENEHHRHRFSVIIGIGPRHYADGYYDRWGYWHPYTRGYYDRRGYWHSQW